jgi:4,4'-diaponeurosporenoate glycosyltransferase
MIPWPLILVFLFIGSWMLFNIPDFTRLRYRRKLDLAHVSVIVPARNEELRIQPLLESLQKQSTPAGEVIVVDDQSEDHTAQMAAQAGFTVLPASPLPTGWQGKSWACWQGAEKARGDVIVFLDADTILADDGLARIYHEFQKSPSPLSVQPYHRISQFYENLSAYFNLVLMMGTCSFTPLGSRIQPQAFFGPCQIMLRSDYLQSGGHSSTRSSVLDDVALGQHLTRSGIPIRNFSGRGVIDFRMYPHGIPDVIQGWSKNFALGSQSIGFLPMLLIACWIWGSFALFVDVIRTFFQPFAYYSAALPTLYVFAVFQLWQMLRRVGNFSPLTALLFPIPLLFFVLVFMRAAILSGLLRKVTWKGRSISTRKEP